MKISFLLLRVFVSGLKTIKCFSLVQRLHTPVVGENGAARPNILYLIWYCFFSSFNFQICIDRVVEFRLFSCLKSELWFKYLVLNIGAVSPTYLLVSPSSVLIVAWYTTFLAVHLSGRGHSVGWSQLHLSGVVSLLAWFSNFALCLAMCALTFGKHLYESFTLFLFIRGCNIELGGKCLSNNAKNLAPILVLTLIEYGGLNQIIFLFLFLFFGFSIGGSNLSVWEYPFLFSSSWYKGAALSKISSVAEIAESLLFIASGIFFIMEGVV